MKKVLFSAMVILLGSGVMAQKLSFGVKFAPNISTSRVIEEISDWNVEKDKGALKFSTGLVVDYFFQDNFALSSGLSFAAKQSSINADFLDSSFTVVTSDSVAPTVDLQYVQIPVGLKFYTNEVANRMQLYFLLQGMIEVKVSEKIENNENGQIENDYSKFFDGGVNIGTGIELGVGESNKVFAGVTYNRGLVNILTKDFHEAINKKEVQVNNDLFSLVVGFKF